MNFEFATAARIIFGPGTAAQAGPLAAQMGRRACVVFGKSRTRADPVVRSLKDNGIKIAFFTVPVEPTTEIAQQGAQFARDEQCDLVVGVGGGSVIDTGKVIATLLTNEGEPLDYMEVVGKGRKPASRAAPCIAVPTTAGTGAEVTQNAVLQSPEHRVKASMRSPLMLPAAAIIDPDLTLSMPPPVTAATGLDALTQLIESYTSNKANPLTDGICREGMMRAARSLQKCHTDGNNRKARQDMAVAALFGGLALANAKLGAVHGIAGPLGGMFPVPHGTVCARLLPHVIETNVRALRSREPDSPLLARYVEVGRILTGRPRATVQDGVDWIVSLCKVLRTPGLAEFGVTADTIPEITAKAQNAGSMKANPIGLTDDEVSAIIERGL